MMAMTRIIRIHPRWNLTTIYWIFIKEFETWDQAAIPRLKTLDALTWLWLGGMHPAVWGFSGKLQRLQICNTKLLRRWGQTLFWVADHVLALSEKEKKMSLLFLVWSIFIPELRLLSDVFPSHQKVTLCLPALRLPRLLPLRPWLWLFSFFSPFSKTSNLTEWHVRVIKLHIRCVANSRSCGCGDIKSCRLIVGRWTFIFQARRTKCIPNLSVFIRAWHKAFN